MAKIAARSEEVRKRSEFKCMPRLCNILDSQNGCSSPEIISNKLIIDYSRMLNHRASFDDECRKIQNVAELGSSTVKGNSVRSLRNAIREDTEILKQKTEGTKLCEDLPMSILLEKHERVDSNMLQIQMSAKDFLDQIVADRKPVCKKGMKRIEMKPFSNALQVLHSDKDLFLELLSEPLCMPKKCIESLQNCSESNRRLALKREVQNGSVASFSVREMKRKLKHTFRSRRRESDRLPNFCTSNKLSHKRSIFGHDCIYSGVETKNPLRFGTNAKTEEKLGEYRGLKAGREPLVPESEAVRKKIDLSSDSFRKKDGVDEDLGARSNIQKQWRVLSSFEVDSCLSLRRESHYVPCSAQVSWSPCRPSRETRLSLVPSSYEEEAREAIVSPTPNMKFNDTPNVVVTDSIRRSERAAKIKLHEGEKGGVMHFTRASITENETFSHTAHEFPSSPTLDSSDSNKYQDERQSPISVLDQFFTEDSASPSNATFQSARGPLKPRRLRFEEHGSSSSSTQDYTIPNYVRLLLEASSLNWDQLSAIRPQSEQLLHPSLFDQGQFLMFDSHFHTRLIFDHVNEVLLETKRSHFASPYWPAFAKPRICSLPLEEAVVDEIMRESEFYLLPRTQRRTLDQLLAVDFSGPRSRPDFRAESEQIIAHVSEDIIEESVLDVVLQLYS